MSKPFEKVSNFIDRHSMLRGARGVVVAVSGGPDSIALLDMLLRLKPPRLRIAHLDHRLRGPESASDADFVRELAAGLNLPVTIASVDVRREAEARGRGIEETAREARYGFLLKAALASGSDRIATGHTMNDQAETFLMRLARGAGLRGLSGMRPVSPAHLFEPEATPDLSPHPSIIRPLLCLSREEVEEYCRDRDLAFRIDPSNSALDYTRNRVRGEVLPALRSINPRVVERISRAAELISGDQDALERIAATLLDGARLDGKELKATGLDGALGVYRASALREQPSALRRRMIIEALGRARAKLSPGARPGEITSVHVEAVEGLLEQGMSGRRVTLPQGLEAWRDFDALVLKISLENPLGPQAQGALESRASECEISCARPSAEAGGLRLTLVCDQPRERLEASLAEARRERERAGRDWMVAVLDAGATPPRLVVRPRRSGERAHVLGHRKTKKLKNLMIDHKIPSSLRAVWPVVATPDGRYVWSPGLPPSVEFAANDETPGLAILRASGI